MQLLDCPAQPAYRQPLAVPWIGRASRRPSDRASHLGPEGSSSTGTSPTRSCTPRSGLPERDRLRRRYSALPAHPRMPAASPAGRPLRARDRPECCMTGGGPRETSSLTINESSAPSPGTKPVRVGSAGRPGRSRSKRCQRPGRVGEPCKSATISGPRVGSRTPQWPSPGGLSVMDPESIARAHRRQNGTQRVRPPGSRRWALSRKRRAARRWNGKDSSLATGARPRPGRDASQGESPLEAPLEPRGVRSPDRVVPSRRAAARERTASCGRGPDHERIARSSSRHRPAKDRHPSCRKRDGQARVRPGSGDFVPAFGGAGQPVSDIPRRTRLRAGTRKTWSRSARRFGSVPHGAPGIRQPGQPGRTTWRVLSPTPKTQKGETRLSEPPLLRGSFSR